MTDDTPTPKRAKRTLLARVAEMGHTHAEAFGILSRRDPAFAEALREALAAGDKVEERRAQFAAAEARADAAKAALGEALEARDRTLPTISRLDTLAASIASADTPRGV